MKRRPPYSTSNAPWIPAKSGKNIQNGGWHEQVHQRLLKSLEFIRLLRIMFFSGINAVTGPSLAQQIAFLEPRKIACNSFLIHQCLLCGGKQAQKEYDEVLGWRGLDAGVEDKTSDSTTRHNKDQS